MKYFLLLLLAVFPAYPSYSQLESYNVMQEASLQEMEQILIDFGAVPALFNIEYDVKVYKVHYLSLHPNGELIPASGALAVPVGMDCPKSMAAYMHGTVLPKTNVPSYGSDELKIGMILASSGYVVALPDYLGLGDSPGLHPYVHAKSEATAGIDLLRCARNIADLEGLQLNEQLFIFGYSQGGHAAMALHREIQQFHSDEFTVTASAPMSGPYDISGAQTIYLTQDVPYSSPVYLPYVLLAYQTVYDFLPQNPSDFLAEPYATELPPLFMSGDQNIGYVNGLCNPIPNQMIIPEVYESYTNNPDHYFRAALEDNDVYQWVPEAPVKIYYCAGDDQVYYQNAEVAYNYFIANGAENVQKVDFGNFDHAGCVPFALLNGKFFFDSLRDLSGGMQLTYQVNYNETGYHVSVAVSGGQPPYSYTWTGSSIDAPEIDVPAAGTIAVTAVDSRGCSNYLTINLNDQSPLGMPEQDIPVMSLYPNPSYGDVWINMDDKESLHRITITNLSGQMILDIKGVREKYLINKGILNKGVYLIHIDDTALSQKLLIL